MACVPSRHPQCNKSNRLAAYGSISDRHYYQRGGLRFHVVLIGKRDVCWDTRHRVKKLMAA